MLTLHLKLAVPTLHCIPFSRGASQPPSHSHVPPSLLSPLQLLRRLAPYWSKSYISPATDKEEMALRLEELCAKSAQATAAPQAACWAREAFDDSHSYAEQVLNKVSRGKVKCKGGDKGVYCEELLLRLRSCIIALQRK